MKKHISLLLVAVLLLLTGAVGCGGTEKGVEKAIRLVLTGPDEAMAEIYDHFADDREAYAEAVRKRFGDLVAEKYYNGFAEASRCSRLATDGGHTFACRDIVTTPSADRDDRIDFTATVVVDKTQEIPAAGIVLVDEEGRITSFRFTTEARKALDGALYLSDSET